jgi:polyisoprenoid-binding protein YceI
MDLIPTDSLPDLARFAGSWSLDVRATSVAFHTRSLWIVPVKGTAKALGGDAVLRPDGSVSGTLAIDATSFDTGNKKRDDHLRGDDFLAAEAHPVIAFETTIIKAIGPGELEIDGRLTVRGIDQPLCFVAALVGSNDEVTLSTALEVDRSRWGSTWGARMGVGLKSRLTVQARFSRVGP